MVPERSLDYFLDEACHIYSNDSYMSIFKYLPALEVVLLLGSPERHTRSLGGSSWFLRGV